MTKIAGVMLFILLVVTLGYSGPTENKVFPYPIHQTMLDNGLKVIAIPFDSPGIVAYYTIVRTGSRNEVEPGKSGFAHFFEHMMFRGTEKYPKDKFNGVLKSIGADNNAYTSDDQTVYHTVASAAALETMMDIESDRFMNLKYTEEDFKTESGAILGEYNKSSSNPFQTIDEKMREIAFGEHTYRHTTIGFIKDIEDMPNQYQYSLTFFDRWYRPENCVVLVVGDVQPDNVFALAKKYYSAWKHGTYKLDVPQEPPQTAEKTGTIPWKAKTLPILTIAYHGPAFSDKDIDYAAMELLSQCVFSETSELYHNLVVDKQLVEFVQGGNEDHRDPYLFSIFSRIKDPKDIALVRDAIYAALEDTKSNPVTQERLDGIKAHLKYQYAMSLNSPDPVANSLATYIELTGDAESVNRVYAMFDRVTPQDIMTVAKKYFTPQNRTVVTLQQQEVKQ